MTKDELQNCFQQGKLGEVPLCKCYLKYPPPEPNLLHHSNFAILTMLQKEKYMVLGKVT